MKILLASENVWWNNSDENLPGYADEKTKLATIVREYFGGKLSENFSQIQDTNPNQWTPTSLNIDIDKTVLMKTHAGKSMSDLMQVNYAAVEQNGETTFWFVDTILLQASKVNVTLTNDIWVNVMSHRRGLGKEIIVDREHVNRFIVDENGVPTGFDYSAGSAIHLPENLEGITPNQIKKKRIISPFLDWFNFDAHQVDYKAGTGKTSAGVENDSVVIAAIKAAGGPDITADKLIKFYQYFAGYTLSKVKWLKSFQNSSQMKDEAGAEIADSKFYGAAFIPLFVLAAPIQSLKNARHRFLQVNSHAPSLYQSTASEANTLGFQIVSIPDDNVLWHIKDGLSTGKLTIKFSAFLNNDDEAMKELGEWLVDSTSHDIQNVFEKFDSDLHFAWDKDKVFTQIHGEDAGDNFSRMSVSESMIHKFSAENIGKVGQVSEARFEPKLNVAPFAKYNFASAINEGSILELNRMYGEKEFEVQSLTSLSPENTVHKLLIGKSYTDGLEKRFAYAVGGYVDTDMSGIGAHWSNPFYPPVINDTWKQYVLNHKASVISGAITTIGSDIGKFGMAVAGGGIAGGPMGALAGGAAGIGSAVSNEIGFWSHRSDMKQTPQKVGSGGAEWTVAIRMDISTYLKSTGLISSDEIIAHNFLRANGYISGQLKTVDLKSRKRYNFIKVNSNLNNGFFPGENIAPVVIDSISEMLQNGVRIWHEEINVMNYEIENWEVNLKEVQ